MPHLVNVFPDILASNFRLLLTIKINYIIAQHQKMAGRYAPHN